MKSRSPAEYFTAEDRHPADVKAALEKSGWSLRRLSVQHGFRPESLAKALYHSWPRAEQIIAMAIGEQPEQIWPNRYGRDGESSRRLLKQGKRAKNEVRRDQSGGIHGQD
tara:strand:- start:486 stop:815 length:330 start_codon:yes stop_codon:yes gene_type:complete